MPASANDIGVLANFLTPRGFEQIDISDGLVHSLTPPTDSIELLALIQVTGGDFRYRDDGTPPTSAVGYVIYEKMTFQYNVKDLNLIEFIQSDTVAGLAINVSYYSFADLADFP